MSNIAAKRIFRELTEIKNSEDLKKCNIHLELKNDCLSQLRGTIQGPPDTPYQDGTFVLDIEVPGTYPFTPPVVRFETRVWHPNISSATGVICLDVLKENWAPTTTLRTILLSVQSLLGDAEPYNAQDGVVARQYITNQELFLQTARHWTAAYAGGTDVNEDFIEKIKQMAELGFDEDQARYALSSNNWELEPAIDFIYYNN